MRAIGMISGTSFDAIEAVAADFELSNGEVVCDLLAHVSVAYGDDVRAGIAAMLPPASTTLELVCRLDTAIGQAFAEVAEQVLQGHCDGRADVICAHGQTMFHWVEGARALGTLQLGAAAWVAERTGVAVLSDVRSRDVAAGGQGAPLASLLDTMLLAPPPGLVRAALNLGGISNVTVLEEGNDPVAFDIGPANALMDAAVDWSTGGREHFDRDGRRGAAGEVVGWLLESMLAEPYYALPPPKSTGKELFHLDYLKGHLAGRTLATDDLVATLTALSAETVAAALRGCGAGEVVAAGGGTRNPTLVAGIARRLPGVAFGTIDAFGVAEAAKEALLMALIAFLSVHGLPGTVPACTGARHASILGSLAPGAAPLVLPAPATAPSRLVVRTPLPGTGDGRLAAAAPPTSGGRPAP